MDKHELDVLMGRDPISLAMNCVHDYVRSDGGGARCPKCETEITEAAIGRYGIRVRLP